MRLNVICKKCDHFITWDASHEEETCPYCKALLTIKDVRMSPLEFEKFQKFKKDLRYAEIEAEKRAERVSQIQPITLVETKEEEPRLVVEQPVLKKPELKEEDLLGRSIIKKGKAKYGTIELTNPDYMILKFTFWTQGPQQKEMTKSLSLSIRRFLEDQGFVFEKF